jgi:uncharacterized protein YyaL (SSP411 family)
VLPGADYYALADAERRALGLPRTDTALYASLNGLLIDALARLAQVDPEGPWLTSARAAAERLERTHRRGDAFAHAANDPPDALLHLADQAYMARGLATLGETTGDPRWFALAERTLVFAEVGCVTPSAVASSRTPPTRARWGCSRSARSPSSRTP